MSAPMFSSIIRHPRAALTLPRAARWGHALPWLLTLAAGVPLLCLALHLISPSTPLLWLALPMVLGALAPAGLLIPGQFMLKQSAPLLTQLDTSLHAIGYRRASGMHDRLGYVRARPWLHQQEGAISIAVHDQLLNITGPIGCLRLLQHQLSRQRLT